MPSRYAYAVVSCVIAWLAPTRAPADTATPTRCANDQPRSSFVIHTLSGDTVAAPPAGARGAAQKSSLSGRFVSDTQ